MKSSLVWAEIDLKKLRNNLRLIRSRLVKSGVEILAIIKADAYGHGMNEAAKIFYAEGVRFFGVASLEEAITLRKTCPTARILVLGAFHGEQIEIYFKKNITPTISSAEDARGLENYLNSKNKKMKIHLKIDTGMGRFGVWHEDLESLLIELKNQKSLEVEGVYTHFANADHAEKARTTQQLSHFNRALLSVKRAGIFPKYIHAANSLGILRFKNAHFNMVRPGIILYGMNPVGGGTPPLPKGIQPILSLKTRIAFLKTVEKGRPISYGSTYRTTGKTTIATLPIGYSHGYKVGFSNKASVIIRGKRCPVIGRVTMDHTLVDVTGVPGVKRWEEVTLIGGNGGARIRAEELAAFIQSISYEITCSIHSRIPRVYIGQAHRP